MLNFFRVGTEQRNDKKKKNLKMTEATEDKTKETPTAVKGEGKAESTSGDNAESAAKEESLLLPGPVERDICVGESLHKGNMLLIDLIRIHYVILKKEKDEIPSKEEDVKELAERLTKLLLEGKRFELSGLKDVPKPFLKGPGRFFEKKDDKWVQMSEDDAQAFVTKEILSVFKSISEEESPVSSELMACVETLFTNSDPETKATDDPSHHSAPRPCDVLFLPVEYPWEENMPYEHQSGNKHLLFLASQHVAADTNDSTKRVEAAFKLVTSKVEVNSGTELLQKTPRYVAQELKDNQNSWREFEKEELAEFACIFTFEVFLEKQIHGMGVPLSSQVANLLSETAKPSTVPVENPTPHDVLFGRGGMTNGHPGNRRFRDIIALHRPDYIRATKMDKPNVARRIVRAIRQGSPPGRFLKKNEDGKWYDVGDRCAAEKTSQGLRERSNAEKRQRSALREALRIRREDLEDGKSGEPSAKKTKTEASLGGVVPSYVSVASQLNYTGGIPLSLSMKDQGKDTKGKKGKKGKDGKEEDDTSESLPPNAVDKDGNILVTDYDILCGRGGLTNHHKGNKRFRDIVALHRSDYVRAPKIQKPSVARVIVRAIRNGDPPGRFLRKDEKTGKWVDIGDKKAAEKTSQALREKTGEEKERPAGAPFQSPTLIVPGPATLVPKVEDPESVNKADAKAEDNADAKKDATDNGKEEKVNTAVESVEV